MTDKPKAERPASGSTPYKSPAEFGGAIVNLAEMRVVIWAKAQELEPNDPQFVKLLNEYACALADHILKAEGSTGSVTGSGVVMSAHDAPQRGREEAQFTANPASPDSSSGANAERSLVSGHNAPVTTEPVGSAAPEVSPSPQVNLRKVGESVAGDPIYTTNSPSPQVPALSAHVAQAEHSADNGERDGTPVSAGKHPCAESAGARSQTGADFMAHQAAQEPASRPPQPEPVLVTEIRTRQGATQDIHPQVTQRLESASPRLSAREFADKWLKSDMPDWNQAEPHWLEKLIDMLARCAQEFTEVPHECDAAKELRDALAQSAEQKEHGIDKKCCYASTNIADQASFGRGTLDDNGFWEFPCPHEQCKREVLHLQLELDNARGLSEFRLQGGTKYRNLYASSKANLQQVRRELEQLKGKQ